MFTCYLAGNLQKQLFMQAKNNNYPGGDKNNELSIFHPLKKAFK